MLKDIHGNSRFYGVYRGVVVANDDPKGLGRLKVQVPQVLGTEVTDWAWAVHQPGVTRTVPDMGTGVFVMFEGGDPSFPIWTGSFNSGPLTYGSFYDTTNQTISSTTTAYPMLINVVDQASNVSIVDGSKITIAYPGTYNLQFSGQFKNTDTQAHDIEIWLRYNGQDYPWSSSVVSVPSKHGAVDGHVITAWNWVGTSQNPNDYVQIMWSSESTTVSMETRAAGTSPTRPAIPSLIVTLTEVK